MQAHAGQMHPVTRGIWKAADAFPLSITSSVGTIQAPAAPCLKIFDLAGVGRPNMPTIPTLAAQPTRLTRSSGAGVWATTPILPTFCGWPPSRRRAASRRRACPSNITFLRHTPDSEQRLCAHRRSVAAASRSAPRGNRLPTAGTRGVVRQSCAPDSRRLGTGVGGRRTCIGQPLRGPPAVA